MSTNCLILMVIGPFQLILLLLLLLIPLIVIPNRKYKEISENEIDQKVKNLNLKERISFKYKGVKVSLKRIGNKLKIEPYTNRFIELLFRVLGFSLAMIIVIFVLVFVAQFLDSMGVGDKSLSDGTFVSFSWQAWLQNSTNQAWFIYFIIFYFFGKLLREKIFNAFLIRKHKKVWDEFYTKYHFFKY
jgi:hypothetical protein